MLVADKLEAEAAGLARISSNAVANDRAGPGDTATRHPANGRLDDEIAH